MSSTEDDTFRMLKSLTEEEAMELFYKVYNEFLIDLGNPGTGVSLSLIAPLIDLKLKPYGWSFNKLFSVGEGNFS